MEAVTRGNDPSSIMMDHAQMQVENGLHVSHLAAKCVFASSNWHSCVSSDSDGYERCRLNAFEYPSVTRHTEVDPRNRRPRM